MRVLVACEYSGRVREAFRKLGHDAWSCDLLPADDESEFHYQGDVFDFAQEYWDMMIAFPPCTHLAVSGAKHFAAKRADGRQQRGIDFFMEIVALGEKIGRYAIENPIGIMSTEWRKPDQIIQPWQFGHMEQKATCLWLKSLKLLQETKNVRAEMMLLSDKERQRLHYLPPSKDRWKIRSTTYQGIANAMADQWGKS